MFAAPYLLFLAHILLCAINFKGAFCQGLLLAVGSSSVHPGCKTFEEPRICGPKCPITCDTLNTNICCEVTCMSGCFCRDGYILVSNNSPRKCVPINDCPKPGILEFKDLTLTVLESAKVVEIVVLRLNGSAGEISVGWRTEEGSSKERTDFEQSTGILVFPEGVTSRIITIKIFDDSIRESDEYFSVILSDPTNKAEINPRIMEGVRIVIKDDDMQPGYIEVENINVTVPENFGTVMITLVRVGGSDGIINIQYRTVDVTAGGQLDYIPLTGVVTFNEGERRKTVPVIIIDDDLRESSENFQVQFFNPSVPLDVINFRQQSSRLTAIVTILDNDMKPGYIELEVPTITVLEKIGEVSLNLVRIGGTDGQIRIRYRVVDGTAVSSSDYMSVIGDVVFNEGEKKKTIPVSIIDDDVREPSENFQFVLFDPTAAPDVVNFRAQATHLVTTVIILDDDMKPGYLELEQINSTIREDFGILQMNVIRVEGTDGILRLKYRTVQVTATDQVDYVPILGDLEFKDGESKKTINIVILNDDIRESIETFQLQLFDLVAGPETINFRALGSRLTALITIIDDDAKPGYVELSNTAVTVLENVGSISLNVVRKDGQDGEIRTNYRTVDGTAVAPSDYISRSGELVFEDGVTLLPVTVNIINDDVMEPVENFRLELFDFSAAPDVLNFRAMNSKTSTIITIIDDDMKPGHLELEQVNITVREDYGTLEVNVIRTGGTDGILHLKYRAVDITTTVQLDYAPVLGSLVFNDGESRKSISIVILNDNVKEPIKTFRLELFDFTAGTGTINFRASGIRETALITIIDDDDNPGVFQFQSIRFSVPESVGSFPLTIIRKDGSDGQVRLQLRTMSSIATEGVDFIPPPLTVIFPDGVVEQTIRIQIVDDNVKEVDENFLVGIFNPTNGGILGGNKLVTVVIIDDDDPCIIRFVRRIVNLREISNYVEVPVMRENHLDRRVSVYWRTEDRAARTGLNYRGTSGTLMTFEPRQSLQTLKIGLLGHSQYESSDLFDIILFDPRGGAVLGVPSRSTVHLLDYHKRASSVISLPSILSDALRIQISFTTQNIRVSEDAGAVHISVSRTGNMSPFTVRIQTLDGSAVQGRDYRRVTGSLSFKEGDVTMVIAIRILDDEEYEPDETFTIQLLEPSLGIIPIGMGTVTVTIVDNDGAVNLRSSGRTSVRSQSRLEGYGSSGYGFLTKCPDHLILKECANTCPPTCSSMHGKVPCSYSGCIRGCFCPEGLVKASELSDSCVKPSDCPRGTDV